MKTNSVWGEERALGGAVCSCSPSRGLSPSLGHRLLNALGWVLLGEKIWKRAWFCIALERFGFHGAVNSPLGVTDAIEDSSARSLQDQHKQHFSAHSTAFSCPSVVFAESLLARMTRL